jgi:hypothetical protein
MNRRDFLLLRAESHPRGLHDEGTPVLSCERLYMRYLDSQMDGSTSRLFTNLREDLRRIKTLRLTETSWLSCGELKAELDAALHDTGVTEIR